MSLQFQEVSLVKPGCYMKHAISGKFVFMEKISIGTAEFSVPGRGKVKKPIHPNQEVFLPNEAEVRKALEVREPKVNRSAARGKALALSAHA